MRIKRIIAAAALTCIIPLSALSAGAQEQTDSSLQTESSVVQNAPTLEPTKVKLEVGEISNFRFPVNLDISPEIPISGATISIEYDSDLLELKSSSINTAEIGGISVDSHVDGKYTFTYMNVEGTQFSGTYSTLTFRIKDKTMTSTVIYVSAESLEDVNLLSVPNVVENGIVNYRSAEPANAVAEDEKQFKEIKFEKTDEPVTLESLGIQDVKKITVSDNQTAFAEDGMITVLSVGKTNLTVTHNDGSISYYTLIVSEPEQQEISSDAAESSKKSVKVKAEKNNGRTTAIIIAIAAAVIAVIAEYIVIVKPFGRLKKVSATIYRQDSEDESDNESDED